MATRGFLERSGNQAKALALILDGKTDSQVAAALSSKKERVGRAAVTFFRHRHQEEIKARERDLNAQATGILVANKRYRLGIMDAFVTDAVARIKADGLMIEERSVSPDGEVLNVRYRPHPLLPMLRRYLRDAAEEMGQIPRWQAPAEGQGYGTPGDVAVAQNVETQQVIIYRGGGNLDPDFKPPWET